MGSTDPSFIFVNLAIAIVRTLSASSVAFAARLLPTIMRSDTSLATSILPAELLSEVVDYLDSEADRATLIALLRVSSAFWEAAARVLYRSLYLDWYDLERLLTHGRDIGGPISNRTRTKVRRSAGRDLEGGLSQRTRRALRFVCTLHILAPLYGTSYHLMWDAAAEVPNVPLFPNVSRLRLSDPSELLDRYRPHIRSLTKGAVLFDAPQVCLTGFVSRWMLQFLPSIRLPAVCLHATSCNSAAFLTKQSNLPTDCDSFRLFEQYNCRRFQYHSNYFAPVVDETGCHFPRIQVCYADPELEKEMLECLDQFGEHRPWEPNIQIKCYENAEDCPPCAVCGTSRRCVVLTLQGGPGYLVNTLLRRPASCESYTV